MADEKKKDESAQEEGLNPKYLKGILFRTSEAKKVNENNVEKLRYTPVERDLTVNDVLNYKDNGNVLIIVTKDGQKYTISKKGK